MAEGTCSIADCGNPRKTRGWCGKHYMRWLTHGDPLHVAQRGPRTDSTERFWSKVDKSGDCWLWTGGMSGSGYGTFYLSNGRMCKAHRYAYELLVGLVPQGLELDHLCRVRACVRATHLEPVTHAENMRRGARASATHCKNGHEYTTENTLWRRGRRDCRECLAAASRRSKQSRRERRRLQSQEE